MEWEEAEDVRKDLINILGKIDLPYIDMTKIHCFRTTGSKTRAYARTWAFPKIFQRALGVQPAYVIEVLSKYYDRLDQDAKMKVLIHELLHIPKNFSGALLPHSTRSRNLHTVANQLFKDYKKSIKR
ncbi:MAG TPA: putative metallopeptidase [Candidatus Saccharimonadales bacterium]|nr:putative metallopeptidase [Candidatus Saccharimonadales bacterium]